MQNKDCRCLLGVANSSVLQRQRHMATLAITVPKSVTLNDLERRNDRYIAVFRRIR